MRVNTERDWNTQSRERFDILICLVRNETGGVGQWGHRLSRPSRKQFTVKVFGMLREWIKFFQEEATYVALDVHLVTYYRSSIYEIVREHGDDVILITKPVTDEAPQSTLNRAREQEAHTRNMYGGHNVEGVRVSHEILLDRRKTHGLVPASHQVDMNEEPPFVNSEYYNIEWI